jgi:23S rRNA (cytidine2498-2'-O)-methyltransferase
MWLLRVPEVFSGMVPDLFDALGVRLLRRVGREFHLVSADGAPVGRDPVLAAMVPWRMRIDHAWPCVPERVDGFVEKAARAMADRFGDKPLQTVIAGPLDPSDPSRRGRRLASNLRGRALQLFPPACASLRDPLLQDPVLPSLFVLVGDAGLYCGMCSPRDANGFHAGGIRHFPRSGPGVVSRAGGKIAGALGQLALWGRVPVAGTHWLDLGASPGGISAELLARGYRVTAVDRAPLDPALRSRSGLREVCADAGRFDPRGERYGAIVCDINGDPLVSFGHVARMASALEAGGIAVFTLKLTGGESLASLRVLAGEVIRRLPGTGLSLSAADHLGSNRRELTLFLEKEG